MTFKKKVLIIEALLVLLTVSSRINTISEYEVVNAETIKANQEIIEVEVEEQQEEFTIVPERIFYFEKNFAKTDKQAYIIERTVYLKDQPFEYADDVVKLVRYDELKLIGTNEFDYWKVEYNGHKYYVHKDNITTDYDDVVKLHNTTYSTWWTGPVLTPRMGTVTGPNGRETYYNLNMNGVIAIMRRMGYDGKYWVREDGVKMLGDYIMCAANLNIFPRGSLVESSLGTCIVCDTGGFALVNPTQLDIAVVW